MNSLKFCTDTLAAYGANESEVLELLAYNQNVFTLPGVEYLLQSESEPYLATWEQYVQESHLIGAYATLQTHLVQLQFPIVGGISETSEYRSATRKGKSTAQMKMATGLTLLAPENLQLYIHQTLAGGIPVLVAGNRHDFVSLVQALTKRNEPHSIPESMGACIVQGYNNWDRVRQYQQEWLEKQQDQNQSNWETEFQNLIQHPELYRDRFILLSSGVYSNVRGAELGLEEQQWLELSVKIRLEHECTHYVTRRWFGSMRNNILDELIADYRGIVNAIGYYRADWFLHFVGLEAFPTYRQGGRLENYRGEPSLSQGAFIVLQRLVKTAAENIEEFDQKFRQSAKTRQEEMSILIALTTLRLEELASAQGVFLIESALNDVKHLLSPGCEITPL
ncbi:hypothetical protein SR1949_30920 [Sphaerospermopsis reniformis]|uniref:Uncharacterized protein n=1 Tax=Sphaerospermopsis reniformis TaxID=531300 RepID=A0A479ZZB5_9CYAN|nr:hypothetical protein [Sphaerospermopsis reniformis]GCL37979.1 hypothetical protein SR1949_30920 [Sphaerospermopsis reniformis]